MYFKGGNMLHTIRQIINDDEKWRNLLRGMNRDFHNKVVSGVAIENYMTEQTGIDLSTVFDQYLRDTRIPVLEYYIRDGKLFFRWINCVAGFRMPLKIRVSGKETIIFPTTFFDSVFIEGTSPEIGVDPNFYVGSMNMTGK
jgi:aminopeptidase N